MPELPEVETIRRTIMPGVIGAAVRRVTLRRADIARHLDERLRRRRVSDADARRALLEGSAVADIRRRGKQLALVADSGRVVIVQLGMSGRLLLPTGPARPRHAHCEWSLHGGGSGGSGGRGGVMVFEDARRFGGLTTLPSAGALDALWARLGPDALLADGSALRERAGRSRRCVKAALLDQRVLAGVGNIYADEALFRAGIAPGRRCDRVDGAAWDRLGSAIRAVLAEAVRAGGSTVRDYRDASGGEGRYQEAHAVYGRGGEPCVRCGMTLRRAEVSQRTTVWCPGCQR